ncbi:MAG TPA: protein kinase [Kofleriaceae bacterium]
MVEGAQIGAYRVLRPIGEGGMGSVWLAEHIALGRRAALKMLRAELSNRPDIVARFFNEARAATSIADPGIVQIFDFGRHVDGSAYIVMELLDGEPLDRRLRREGALTVVDGLRVLRQVASTLDAAHARGIVHRDLKPENIFIVRDPEVPGGERPKVLDFGIAKLAGDHVGVKTQTAAVMGTPAFMSPEQCRGAGHVDQRSDVYALGCVLFTLLVGRPPFQADGTGDIIAMHLREPAPAPSQLRPGIPPEVDQLVLRCLAKNAAERFPTAGDLARAIGGLLGSSPEISPARIGGYGSVTAPTTLSGTAGARAPGARAKRSQVGLSAAIAGAGVASVVAAMVAIRGGDRREAPEAPLPTHAVVPPLAADPPPPGLAPARQPDTSVSQRTPLDRSAQVAPILQAALARFVAWSHDYPGAPCPDAALLGAPDDPWGHPLAITCTEQPGDQIAGAISAGPDGKRGTTDDIVSWQLGRDVTDVMRGARWPGMPQRTAAKPGVLAKPRQAALAPAGPDVPAKPGPAEASTKPALTQVPARPAPPVQLDENGLPIAR